MGIIKKSEKFHSAKKYNPLQYLFMATSEKNKAEAKENEYEKDRKYLIFSVFFYF